MNLNLIPDFRTEEERTESLRNVSESLSLAMQLAGTDSAEVYYGKLERRKSKVPDLHSNFNEAPTSIASGQQRPGLNGLVGPSTSGWLMVQSDVNTTLDGSTCPG